ncbi:MULTISPECIES: TnpV protein [unclassified Clostridioides]|uniref:TnpV protein n=1 Tax=unclassified Clostridioides TaxID=2635829 RepID=UPI001D0C1FD5|nr:hypothetical protein [Clostridioides sp. ES-S-0001-02]MCC0642007.1 hypothetical protein [Clostridioides sp. ES-S-0049-03]MCC0650968.1 hypothetical protein [Clostridioides sp. ES-S-0001-03]MCC0671519.1 hypothetical protein [Clostridioides sp. ES-S-0145-01]MCC0677775.1 hypothetical protein [Clostridioides sp. ES-W-0018-02]MCC0713118.1 hypothetical protein [Clostridioides sp. ES-W-0017-02]
MQQTIELLYNGDICPGERTRIRLGGYKAAREIAMKAHDALEDTMERIRLRTQAQTIADEIVFAELIYT